MNPLFPWFGGKRQVAAEVWRRLGNVDRYIEPFAGAAAVLLRRPDSHCWWDRYEIINDADGMVANVWRAIQADPDGVARWADWPANEVDMHARNRWLIGQREPLTERLEADPDYYDVKVAGWWLWGIGLWVGPEWAVRPKRGKLKMPPGGVHRREGLVVRDDTVSSYADHILAVMRTYQHRMRTVQVYCGDWTRVVTDALLRLDDGGVCGVFLDPPYSHAERDSQIYAVEMGTADAVRRWAIEHGDDPRMRIALCGYDGEHDMPDTWTAYRWTAQGGMAWSGDGRGLTNREREVVWCSPHCLRPARQISMFDDDLCPA